MARDRPDGGAAGTAPDGGDLAPIRGRNPLDGGPKREMPTHDGAQIPTG